MTRWRSRMVLTAAAALLAITAYAQTDEWRPDAGRIHRIASVLASPAYAGRDSRDPRYALTVNYVTDWFRATGLKPLSARGSAPYTQPVLIETQSVVSADTGVTWIRHGASMRLPVWQGSAPDSMSHSGTARGGILFAGDGIVAETMDIDDLKGLALARKVVLVRDGAVNPSERLQRFPQYLRASQKARELAERGAVGVLVATTNPVLLQRRTIEQALSPVRIPVLYVDAGRVERMIGRSLKDLAAGTELGSAEMRVSLSAKPVTAPNIVGVLPGCDKDLSKRAYVIGAHADHLGEGLRVFGSLAGANASQIHPGADDNASGVAVMLEIARLLKNRPLRRSVVFVAFSGEELGLKGSVHYVENPLWSLDHTDGMLCLDMLGRLTDNRLKVIGMQSDDIWSASARDAAAAFGVTAETYTYPFGSSDYAPFESAGLRTLFLHTGEHPDYHTPRDTADKLNAEGMARIAAIACELMHRVDASDQQIPRGESKPHSLFELRN